MEHLEGMGEWDEHWGREGREAERKRRREEWDEEGWEVWEMEGGISTLHCGETGIPGIETRPSDLSNSTCRETSSSVGERVNGSMTMEGNVVMGPGKGNGGRMEDVRGGTPEGKHPNG